MKILKRSFIWLQSGISSFIRLEMALKRVKHYHFQFCNPIEKWAFLQKRGSLWQALSPKWFEIQTWDWSRMKENSKIFKISWTKKFWIDFLCLFHLATKGCGFFFYSRSSRPHINTAFWKNLPSTNNILAFRETLKKATSKNLLFSR